MNRLYLYSRFDENMSPRMTNLSTYVPFTMRNICIYQYVQQIMNNIEILKFACMQIFKKHCICSLLMMLKAI